MLIILLILIAACIIGPIIFALVNTRRYSTYGFDWNDLLGGYLITVVPLSIFLIMSLSLCQWNTGEKVYTGYIYSVGDTLNKTVGHIRFSENAGEDSQPSFCAVKGSEDAQKIKELAGTGKKVKIAVPEGLSIQMWYGQCGLPASVEEQE